MNIKYVLLLLVGVLFILQVEDTLPNYTHQDDIYNPYEDKSNCN